MVEELQVPPSRYEQAERSYKSLAEWLHRRESTVRNDSPEVYVQGSFRLGTAIKPTTTTPLRSKNGPNLPFVPTWTTSSLAE